MFSNDFSDEELIDNTPKIQVAIRKRPIGKKELQRNDVDIVEIRGPQTVVVRETKAKVDLTKYIEEHNFNFDAGYDETISNQSLYHHSVRPLVDAAFHGAKVTCFAYGQTGSGKTYTMMGDSANSENKNYMDPVPGLYLLASQDIFDTLEKSEFQGYTIWLSFYEIYCGKLFDLLNNRQQLFAREDAKQNVNIVGIQEKKVTNVQTIMETIEFGNSNRVTGVTGANLDSSRSHAILQINIKKDNKVQGKMSFIDLAGSERGADVVDQNKQTRFDGAEINKSLLALKECIRALDQDKRHTPFRGSKLTLVLKDSFTGNCRTLMIGCISPCATSCEHTLNTLRYADRVKELKKPSGGNEGLNYNDMLAKQLMLPRQTKNAVKIPLMGQNYTSQTNTQFVKQIRPTNSNGGSPKRQYQEKNLYSPNYMSGEDQMGLFDGPMSAPQSNIVINNYFSNNLLSNSKPHSKSPVAPSLNKNNSNPPSGNIYSHISKPTQNIKSAEKPKSKPTTATSSTNISTNLPHSLSNFLSTPQKYHPVAKSAILDSGFQHLSKDEITNWKAQNEDDLQLMSQKHEQLISLILAEEEEVIGVHRQHIDDTVELVKQEMMLLHEVDKPGSDVDEYVESLDAILAHKMEIISVMRSRLRGFKDHLKEEELMSKKFYEQRGEMMDVFDLSEDIMNKNDEIQLLENLPNHN
jgi:kinesin family protein 2/24